MGFSPLELLYGRTVRGPMHIVKELWTKEIETLEVKNSHQYVFEPRKSLALLPTDNNKSLMQWKGPFVIEQAVGLND